jgi:signal transduction histidine kinase
MNLMLNGIDAMKEMSGGSELTIKLRVDDGQLLISVSDTGVGLPPEQADQIFSAFFTTKDNGTGMGLPISRSIIESHGGRLWAAGAPGRGARITSPSAGSSMLALCKRSAGRDFLLRVWMAAQRVDDISRCGCSVSELARPLLLC